MISSAKFSSVQAACLLHLVWSKSSLWGFQATFNRFSVKKGTTKFFENLKYHTFVCAAQMHEAMFWQGRTAFKLLHWLSRIRPKLFSYDMCPQTCSVLTQVHCTSDLACPELLGVSWVIIEKSLQTQSELADCELHHDSLCNVSITDHWSTHGHLWVSGARALLPQDWHLPICGGECWQLHGAGMSFERHKCSRFNLWWWSFLDWSFIQHGPSNQ